MRDTRLKTSSVASQSSSFPLGAAAAVFSPTTMPPSFPMTSTPPSTNAVTTDQQDIFQNMVKQQILKANQLAMNSQNPLMITQLNDDIDHRLVDESDK